MKSGQAKEVWIETELQERVREEILPGAESA